MKIDMNNADGFTGSGGPWVPVDKSMKKLVWSESRATGGQNVALRLPQPETILDFYRDTALIAFPSQAPLGEQLKDANPTFTAANSNFTPALLVDGDPETITVVRRKDERSVPEVLISFPEPYTADTLVLQSVRVKGRNRVAKLEVSSDGKTFRPIGTPWARWLLGVPTRSTTGNPKRASHAMASGEPEPDSLPIERRRPKATPRTDRFQVNL
jgi:hypothetical protein